MLGIQSHLRRDTGEDLFETITLYDNRLVTATCEPGPDDTYVVTLEVEARQYRADGQGVETEIPVDDWIDIAVFGARAPGLSPDGTLLALEKQKIEAGEAVFEIVVTAESRRAGTGGIGGAHQDRLGGPLAGRARLPRRRLAR